MSYLDLCKLGAPQVGLDSEPELPPQPHLADQEVANGALDAIQRQLKKNTTIRHIHGGFKSLKK